MCPLFCSCSFNYSTMIVEAPDDADSPDIAVQVDNTKNKKPHAVPKQKNILYVPPARRQQQVNADLEKGSVPQPSPRASRDKPTQKLIPKGVELKNSSHSGSCKSQATQSCESISLIAAEAQSLKGEDGDEKVEPLGRDKKDLRELTSLRHDEIASLKQKTISKSVEIKNSLHSKWRPSQSAQSCESISLTTAVDIQAPSPKGGDSAEKVGSLRRDKDRESTSSGHVENAPLRTTDYVEKVDDARLTASCVLICNIPDTLKEESDLCVEMNPFQTAGGILKRLNDSQCVIVFMNQTLARRATVIKSAQYGLGCKLLSESTPLDKKTIEGK